MSDIYKDALLLNAEPADKKDARAQAMRQIRTSYGMVFGSEHGKIVLEDLMDNYGWSGKIENPSAVPGMRNEEVWLREGCKQVVRHILRKLQSATEGEQRKTNTETTTK